MPTIKRPARPVSRFWWVLPYCAGALAVFVVAGVIIGLRYNSGTAQPAALPTAEPMPAEMFPDTLFGELTADLHAGNETAFLHLASASAQPAIRTWWDNLRAIGFTTGAVIPTASLDAVHIDSHGDGTTVVLAGAHSPLDPANIRLQPELGGGSLLDVGCYAVHGIRWAFGMEPVRVYATGTFQHGVDTEMSGTLWFAEGRVGAFDCGFTLPRRGWR